MLLRPVRALTLVEIRCQCVLLISFTLLSMLAIPSIVLSVSGSRVRSQRRWWLAPERLTPLCHDTLQVTLDEGYDVWSTSLATIGNIGSNVPYSIPNATVLSVVGGRAADEVDVVGFVKMDRSQAATGVTLCYMLSAVVFLWLTSQLRATLTEFVARFTATKMTPASFAVRVEGLHAGAKWEHVAEHFNRLYDLSRPDWKQASGCLCWCVTRARSPILRRSPFIASVVALSPGSRLPGRNVRRQVLRGVAARSLWGKRRARCSSTMKAPRIAMKETTSLCSAWSLSPTSRTQAMGRCLAAG